MSKTRGEGRSPAEKGGRVIRDPEAARADRERRKAEERDWASRSGPVEIKQVPK